MARPKNTSTASTEVAQEALSYCTSCKMDLNHVIVAMKGDRIAKVQCLTCKKEHVYRAPKGVTTPPVKKSKKKEAESPATSVEAEWQKLMTAHKDTPIKAYSMKGQFGLGDRLKHPTFGEGIVGKLIYPNKLEVIFQTDIKVLIHGGTA
ncbi:MAG: hypothetical protein A2428_13190 [Bdellovibrionales bacterium RIFOXYC1_FULL_54_43]|nr:MAG: hypothetical protein A2428_13190 [Bdellovibrionales bacterium RIFOXYC1_FULL_54_43]OFZ83678.1 MAG: hypothetical protein A2603_16640 [Bdellovibrionales bacterium RIFOXYD1_FULL_55_31]